MSACLCVCLVVCLFHSGWVWGLRGAIGKGLASLEFDMASSLWPHVPSPAKKRHGKQAPGRRNTRLAARGGCLASCVAPCVGRAWRRASHRASPCLAVCIAPRVAVSGVARHSLRRPCLATCVSPCVARVRKKELCSLRAQARRRVVGAQVPATIKERKRKTTCQQMTEEKSRLQL